MSFHRNAKLGLAGRYALVSAIADGKCESATHVPIGRSVGTRCGARS
jgi:hypothetical protein